MIKNIFKFVSMCLLAFTGCTSSPDSSNVFPCWKKGEMEIHHIYTGRGESNFLVLPDGTTMLIDAGDWDPKDYPKMTEALPDSSRRAGEWIARYVQRVNPNVDKVDYLMVSHFHNDHFGDASNPVPMTENRKPNYLLTGCMEAGEYLHFSYFIDRGWPNYNYPLSIQDEDVDNYRAFLSYKMKTDYLKPVEFKVGAFDQIKLLKNPKKYASSFHIRNLSANGVIWLGNDSTLACYDLNPANLTNWQNENTKSIGICIAYGPFRYFTAGDLSAPLLDAEGNWFQVDELVAKTCGEVDVCKANHHAYKDAMSEGFVKNIKATNYIIPVWDYEHIQPSIISRMASRDLYEGDRMVFATNVPSTLRKAYSSEPWYPTLCKEDGHVVVKVYDKGRKYKIFILSAKDENMNIIATYGPYDSKGRDDF